MFPVLVALVLAQFWSKDLYYGTFFIIGSHLANRTTSSDFLNSAPVQWLGHISYSLYLSHEVMIGVLKHHFPGYWMYLVVPVCLGLASALCLVVERPSIYLSRRAGRLVDRVIAGVGRPAQTAPA